MDPTLNEESRTEPQAEPQEELQAEPQAELQTEPQPEPRPEPKIERRRRKPQKRNPIVAYLRSIGKDVRWYYDIRLWSPLLILLFILALLPGKQKAEPTVETTPEVIAVETLPVEETAPVQEALIPEAVALAKLADSVGAGRSNNVKTVIMWVAINRSEDQANGYGQSLLDEIARPNQWQGYDENTPYLDSTYAIAKQVLEIQANGDLRPVDNDMLWFVLNNDGSITLRNQFTATAKQKWHEKTVK